jgi:lipopolysaccharide/colanic/teichoic acid biosynthesis glycosyltransferase
MISDRNRGIQNLVLVCQCVLVTVAFWLWLVLCYYQPIDHQVITRYIVYNEFVLLGLLMGSRPFRPEVGLHTRGFEEVNRRSFRQLGATLFYLLLYIVAARDEKISRLFLFSFIPLLYLVLFTTNRYLPGLLGHLTFRRGQLQKVLLLGPKHKALGVKHWLEENKHLGLEVLGLLTEEASAGMHQAPQTIPNGTTNRESGNSEPGYWPLATGNSRTQTFTVVASGTIPSMKSARWAKAEGEEATSFGGVPLSASPAVPAARNGAASSARSATPVADALRILGRPEDLEKVLAAPGIMKVIMVEFPRANGTMRYYTNLCEARGIRLLVVADIDQIFGHPVAVSEDQGLCLISLREEPLQNPINRFFKRCLDVAISLPVVLFILPPLMLVFRIIQKFQSPGPLFFIQPREGIQKRSFRVFKFRSMHMSDPGNEKRPTSKKDPRLYPLGTFMRRTSLDEMPQFINVLRGEMSVVGPRPHLASYAENYHSVCKRAYVRNLVKPGITGIAQINEARGCAETPELVRWRIRCDIEYLENWSLWMDCWLILRTALQVFIPPKEVSEVASQRQVTVGTEKMAET